MSRALLVQHREIWQRKPLLRALYSEWYGKIRKWLILGPVLEIGGGSGNFKEALPQVISTDIVWVPWLDTVTDAHRLSFKSKSVSNIVVFDVLHHLQNPPLFLEEALRVLTPGGRLIIMEPYVSWLSFPVYRFFHPEPLDLSVDPFQLVPFTANRSPFDANQGIPTLMLDRHWHRFQQTYPAFTKLGQEWLGFLRYPLSGGFDHPSLIPFWLHRPLRLLETCLSPFGSILAFRFLVVLEKDPTA